ncbi:DUF262 domain-containing protein [Gammaproteobacteria bacterium]
MIRYESRRELLSEVIRQAAAVNATYVIPDLQRPYVWSPKQVIMLVDSLFRNWPFGSLLLWEVRPDCFLGEEGIPHRAFWQMVDRTQNDDGVVVPWLGQPATYRMVLDGQQRIQSLILALGGDQYSFRLYDTDWALDLQERRARPSNHWSKGFLCLDLQMFQEELERVGRRVRQVSIARILNWVVLNIRTDRSGGPYPGNYVYPLPTREEHPGRFIRLSRFWDLAEGGLTEDECEDRLRQLLIEHGVNDDRDLRHLAQFMQISANVKVNSFVHALQIESFQPSLQWTRDGYSDAIVNIFTRLNTAGRTLTREEITLAWLKIGWNPAQTGNRTAGQCLKEMQSVFRDCGLTVDMDEMVRLISFVWSVEARKGKLLESRDLLKGEIVRSMAGNLAERWNVLELNFRRGADLIKNRDLSENKGSFNAIIVFLTWYMLVSDRFDTLSQRVNVVGRNNLKRDLDLRSARFLDRWIFGSQWANVWSDSSVQSFQNCATDLSDFHTRLGTCPVNDFTRTVDAVVDRILDRVSEKAIEQITNIVVKNRRRVHDYYSFLWVWHRLDEDRWRYSRIQMRIGRNSSRLEVDHTVAHALWTGLVENEVNTRLAVFIGNEVERILIAPDGFESKQEALTFINILGNCSLLEKSFNISRSDQWMWNFLSRVYEFANGTVLRDNWQVSLGLSNILTGPGPTEEITVSKIREALSDRDTSIRRELIEFIKGKKHRMDIDVVPD